MYKCECGNIFENTITIYENDEPWSVCPACKDLSADYFDAEKCRECGKYIATHDLIADYCKDCGQILASKLRAVLDTAFNKNELLFLDEYVEGYALSDFWAPSQINGIYVLCDLGFHGVNGKPILRKEESA